MPKINQLNSTAQLSNTDRLAIESSSGTDTRSIAYEDLRLQLQNESKSVFALHGEIASNEQVENGMATWLNAYIRPVGHTVAIDKTLTFADLAAEAKATGDMIIINDTSKDTTKLNITTTDTDVNLAEMSDIANLASQNAYNYIQDALYSHVVHNGITWDDLGNGTVSYTGELEDPSGGSQIQFYFNKGLLPDWAENGKTYYVKVESTNSRVCLSIIFYTSGEIPMDGATLYMYEDGTFTIPTAAVGMNIRALMLPNASVSGVGYIKSAILSVDSNLGLTTRVNDLSENAPRLYDYNAYNYISNARTKTGTSSSGTLTFTDLGNGLVSYIGNTEANTQFLFYSDAQNLPEWAEREKTYYIKSKTDNLSVTFSIYCYGANGNILPGSSQLYFDDGTYTIPADAVGMAIRIYAPAGTNVTELSYIKVAILNADSNESLSKEIDRINHYAATHDEVAEEGVRVMSFCLNKIDDAVTPLDIRLDQDEDILARTASREYVDLADSQVETRARSYCDNKLPPIEIRIDGLAIRCNLYDDHFTNLDTRVGNLETRTDGFIARLNIYDGFFADLDTRVGNLEARANIPQPPSANGSYTLKATVNNGRVSYSWQLQV